MRKAPQGHQKSIFSTSKVKKKSEIHMIFIRRSFQAKSRIIKWNLLRKLGTDSNTGAFCLTHQITAIDIASRLQRVSKVPMDQRHTVKNPVLIRHAPR
jgi:hypothetical protein